MLESEARSGRSSNPESRRKTHPTASHMITRTMTPERIRERLAETEGRVDIEAFITALEYVRDDGRS